MIELRAPKLPEHSNTRTPTGKLMLALKAALEKVGYGYGSEKVSTECGSLPVLGLGYGQALEAGLWFKFRVIT